MNDLHAAADKLVKLGNALKGEIIEVQARIEGDYRAGNAQAIAVSNELEEAVGLMKFVMTRIVSAYNEALR